MDEKLASVSEFFEQSLGTAAVGITKGIFNNGDTFRESLVSELTALKVNSPEKFVEAFMLKNLPGLLKETIVVAKDLMNKTPDGLAEVAAMVASTTPRFNPVKKPSQSAIAIHSSVDKKDEKSNLKGEEVKSSLPKAPSAVVGKLFSSIDKRV